ncbi:hypothetical protein Mgra_00004455 [Meloidogyne graminicola]|uniref:G-protein coupled receptors family 1 profile domain-containing protein n=1 Tax=Meloidogyne graminicola TaxID=189291 RepID=A0A8S9ZRU5_9BILA|nr:hypothetical protein Mgra_00004455 [Meloidogyne graminicola]
MFNFGDLTIGQEVEEGINHLSLSNILKGAIILAVFILLFCTALSISLSIADFLCSIFIIPFSFYSSIKPNWAFAGDNSLICKCTVYFHLVLITSTLFTFSWISVDRYAAFMKAYSLTLGILVCLPSLCTVAFTGFAIFTAMQKPDELEDIQRSILENDQNFIITLFILISFILSWLPLIIFQFLPSQLLDNNDAGVMKFAFTWLAIGGGSSKLLIYSFTNKQFRHSLFCCYGFLREEQLLQPKTVEERQLNRYNNTTTTNTINNITLQQQQQQQPNSLSPINAYSFLSGFDYGSFGLGPTGGFLTEQQQQQQNNKIINKNRQKNY